jgi:hypothetical protein
MSEAYTGGCACGAIRYEIPAEPVVTNDCQCRDCQRESGTGHGSHLTFPRIGLERGVCRRSGRIYGCDSARCSYCCRHPYRVMPFGLYIDSVVATSNTSTAAPASITSWILSA